MGTLEIEEYEGRKYKSVSLVDPDTGEVKVQLKRKKDLDIGEADLVAIVEQIADSISD